MHRLFPVLLTCLAVSCRGQARSSTPADTASALRPSDPEPTVTIPPGSPLTPQDFVVTGLRHGMDTSAILRLIGRPDSVTQVNDFRDREATLVTWHYHALTLYLGSYNSLGAVEISGAGVTTARGLRIGDTPDRTRQLYGPPSAEEASEWQYEDPRDLEGLTGMQIRFVEGRVKTIYIGHFYD